MGALSQTNHKRQCTDLFSRVEGVKPHRWSCTAQHHSLHQPRKMDLKGLTNLIWPRSSRGLPWQHLSGIPRASDGHEHAKDGEAQPTCPVQGSAACLIRIL